MSLRPLPGASYHTVDANPLFTSLDFDLEATGSSDARILSKDHIHTSEDRPSPLTQTPSSRTSNRRGPPVLLALLLLCCLAFVASAVTGLPTNRVLFPDVPEGHARLANYIPVMFQAQPYRSLVEANYEGALEILRQKLDRSRVGGHHADLREYLRQTFPLVDLSLDWSYVGQSAVVLNWQGSDPSLKPVLITNSDAVLDMRSQDRSIHSTYSASDSPYGEDETEYTRDLADVESGVGMLTAVETLVRSGYQPSRTLIFSLMLGEASDASQLSKYLHPMYEEQGLVMKFEPPVSECKRGRFEFLRVFRVLFVTVSRAISSLRPVLAKPFDDDKPRLFRYTTGTTSDQALHTELRMRATRAWACLILGADGN